MEGYVCIICKHNINFHNGYQPPWTLESAVEVSRAMSHGCCEANVFLLEFAPLESLC